MKNHKGAEPAHAAKRPPSPAQSAPPQVAPRETGLPRIVGNQAVAAWVADTRESLERDADRAANRVAGAAHPPSTDAAPAGAAVTVPGHGRPLDERTRARFEQALDADLSGVRVHDDAQAAAAAARIGARAYTSGDHIVFGLGQYATGQPRGDWLLAHELRHVSQHAAGLGAGAVHRAPEDVPALDLRFYDGVRTRNFRQAAEALNAFSVEDIRARLAPGPDPGKVVLSRGEIASIHLAAVEDPLLGPNSNAAVLTRPAFLDVNIANSVARSAWAAAAAYLNAFNVPDMTARLAAFTLEQLESLNTAAIASPQLGPNSNVAVLGDRARADARRRKLESQVAGLQQSGDLVPPTSTGGSGKPGSLATVTVGAQGSDTGVAAAQREALPPSTDWRNDPAYIDNQVESATYNIITGPFQVLYTDGGSLELDYDRLTSAAARAGTTAGPMGVACFRHRGNGRIYPVLFNRATIPTIMTLADDVARQEPQARANTEETLISASMSAHSVAGGAVKGAAAAATAVQATRRVRLFSLGARRRNNAQWFLHNVDPAEVRQSMRGFQVYEYHTADGRCLYVGKSGGLHGETPSSWVDRGWDHLNTKPQIAQADRIKVTSGLTHPEAAALETDRIAQLKPRLNQIPGDPPPGQSMAGNLQSASRQPTFTFRTTMVPPGGPPYRR
jgi:hypothetical protein